MSLLDLTFNAMRNSMPGLHESHTQTLWRALYKSNTGEFLPPLKKWIELHSIQFPIPLTAANESVSTDGHTRKFLLQLADGKHVETVLMGFPGRFTACVSTQVGCAMGCVFCATGQQGFTRHLGPGEIVGQVLYLDRFLQENGFTPLRNLVLMGMGEPLHNYESVMTALEILSDTRGTNIGPSRISISTVGVIPGIIRLAEENRPYNLAVSLHCASQPEREKLIPVARRWSLNDLIGACRFYTSKTKRRIFFEWTLIEGKNDSPEQANQLAALLEGVPSHINLIPLNPTDGFVARQVKTHLSSSPFCVLQDFL